MCTIKNLFINKKTAQNRYVLLTEALKNVNIKCLMTMTMNLTANEQ